ncbi:hypothetical protein KFL_006500030 [Klebsormidium nitens]|uniref:SAND domain-containing protein n=1 Tax=Klebsormidium nitens TaxID=105231 RepID=A0A1Y1IM36_KLENI|nr:hypothetical protein KFL_006500030 [Klebsormidium nitens]|eukprot:GAQ90509.1 hypothetical protein KFL_006500030 [Klebsormidium nitens]
MAPRRLPADLHVKSPPSNSVRGNDPLKNAYLGDLHFRTLLEAIAGRLQCLESQHEQDVACLQNSFARERDGLLAQLSRQDGQGKAEEMMMGVSETKGVAGKDEVTQEKGERGSEGATRQAIESSTVNHRRSSRGTDPDPWGKESIANRAFPQEGEQVFSGNVTEAPFAIEVSKEAEPAKVIFEPSEWRAKEDDDSMHESKTQGIHNQDQSLKLLRPSSLVQVGEEKASGRLLDSFLSKNSTELVQVGGEKASGRLLDPFLSKNSTAKQAVHMDSHMNAEALLTDQGKGTVPVALDSTEPGPYSASQFDVAVSQMQDAARREAVRCTCVHAGFLSQLGRLSQQKASGRCAVCREVERSARSWQAQRGDWRDDPGAAENAALALVDIKWSRTSVEAMLLRMKARNANGTAATGEGGQRAPLTWTDHGEDALPGADMSLCSDQDQGLTVKSLSQGDASGIRECAEMKESSRDVKDSTSTPEELETEQQIDGLALNSEVLLEGEGAQPAEDNETVDARERERWSQQMRELAAKVNREAQGWQRYARAAGAAAVGKRTAAGRRGRKTVIRKQEEIAPTGAVTKRAKVLRQGPRQSWKRREALQAAEEEAPREEPRGSKMRGGSGKRGKKSMRHHAAGRRGRKRTANDAEVGGTEEDHVLTTLDGPGPLATTAGAQSPLKRFAGARTTEVAEAPAAVFDLSPVPGNPPSSPRHARFQARAGPASPLPRGLAPQTPSPVREPARGPPGGGDVPPEAALSDALCLEEYPVFCKRKPGAAEGGVLPGKLRIWHGGRVMVDCLCADCTHSCGPTGLRMSPVAFEAHAGRAAAKKWRTSIWIRLPATTADGPPRECTLDDCRQLSKGRRLVPGVTGAAIGGV